jgi:septum formation protein
LLSRLQIPFEVVVSGVEERVPPGLSPPEMVLDLAARKAEAVAACRPDDLVVGADTTVVVDGVVLGKPEGTHDAVRMLRLLRDRVHLVYTGVAVVDGASGRTERRVVRSDVRMRPYDEGEIAAYVATGEPLDKAGGYGIQGSSGALVAGVAGCFNNVVGLPLCELTTLLALFGVRSPASRPLCARMSGEPCPRWLLTAGAGRARS